MTAAVSFSDRWSGFTLGPRASPPHWAPGGRGARRPRGQSRLGFNRSLRPEPAHCRSCSPAKATSKLGPYMRISGLGSSRSTFNAFLRAAAVGTVMFVAPAARAAEHALVLQTDFGLKDGAVAAMRGVAVGVSPRLAIHDLSHENTPFDIWEAAYRLKQAAPYWPEGTVFVSVIDPGVGTARKSVVLKTKSGHLFVGPDNGTLTLVADELGIAAVRAIDETKHRRRGSESSYTFHGRDIFAFVGARLAAGIVAFDDVGPLLEPRVVMLPYERPRIE